MVVNLCGEEECDAGGWSEDNRSSGDGVDVIVVLILQNRNEWNSKHTRDHHNIQTKTWKYLHICGSVEKRENEENYFCKLQTDKFGVVDFVEVSITRFPGNDETNEKNNSYKNVDAQKPLTFTQSGPGAIKK